MRSRHEIDEAMVALSRKMYIRHVYDGTLRERGAGVLLYILEIGVERYLVWQDEDSEEAVVSPLGLWDPENVADVIDGEVPVWLFLKEYPYSFCLKRRRVDVSTGSGPSGGVTQIIIKYRLLT
jgi:hypothetical protein